MHHHITGKNLRERDNVNDLGKDGTYNKLDLTEIKYEGVNWKHLP
jgi:hypothetical protein